MNARSQPGKKPGQSAPDLLKQELSFLTERVEIMNGELERLARRNAALEQGKAELERDKAQLAEANATLNDSLRSLGKEQDELKTELTRYTSNDQTTREDLQRCNLQRDEARLLYTLCEEKCAALEASLVHLACELASSHQMIGKSNQERTLADIARRHGSGAKLSQFLNGANDHWEDKFRDLTAKLQTRESRHE